MNNRIDEHDMTKKMLNIIRENANPANDSIDLNGPELKSEQTKFMDQITPRVDFNVFKIYPNANNVVFSGKFQDMNGMEFQMSLEETDGLYINVSNLQMTDEALKRLQVLRGYYKNWANEWANKLASEYKPNNQ